MILITEIDLRVQYKNETGLSPVATKRKIFDYWEEDRRAFGGFPVSAYGEWLEEKILESAKWQNEIRLREKYKENTGDDPTWYPLYSHPRRSCRGLKPEYTSWLEEVYISILKAEWALKEIEKYGTNRRTS